MRNIYEVLSLKLFFFKFMRPGILCIKIPDPHSQGPKYDPWLNMDADFIVHWSKYLFKCIILEDMEKSQASTMVETNVKL